MKLVQPKLLRSLLPSRGETKWFRRPSATINLYDCLIYVLTIIRGTAIPQTQPFEKVSSYNVFRVRISQPILQL